ncbi:hypothetical protein ABMA27_006377 [Loxostege sticticalis]|uniref:Nucleic-acid-binding protein from transposon X-element n=1 Tax=Loxostege sticticalis TaxID=481309 RepID=A0ABR3IIY0_LOXSC
MTGRAPPVPAPRRFSPRSPTLHTPTASSSSLTVESLAAWNAAPSDAGEGLDRVHGEPEFSPVYRPMDRAALFSSHSSTASMEAKRPRRDSPGLEPRVETPRPPASPSPPPPTSPAANPTCEPSGFTTRYGFHPHSSTPTPTPRTKTPPLTTDRPTYAAKAASPSQPRGLTSPPPTTHPSPPAQSAPQAVRQQQRGHPPIVVECLPDWVSHFERLHKLLGHAPNARPYKAGVRFLPHSEAEFRIVQRYLVDLTRKDSSVQWHCYSPTHERPTKVAVLGLPSITPVADIKTALEDLGFTVEHVRHIPPRRDRAGCVHHVVLSRLTEEEQSRLYAIDELLYMPGVKVVAWRGRQGPSQCHRCQAFGHSSANCHRVPKCVRCSGEHVVADCPRPREATPTCANCGGAHAASDRRCVHFRKEARKRGIAIPPPVPKSVPKSATVRPPPQAPVPPTVEMPEPTPGQTLAPPANNPLDKGARRGGRRRRGRKGKGRKAAPAPPTSEPLRSPTTQPLPERSTTQQVVVQAPPPTTSQDSLMGPIKRASTAPAAETQATVQHTRSNVTSNTERAHSHSRRDPNDTSLSQMMCDMEDMFTRILYEILDTIARGDDPTINIYAALGRLAVARAARSHTRS